MRISPRFQRIKKSGKFEGSPNTSTSLKVTSKKKKIQNGRDITMKRGCSHDLAVESKEERSVLNSIKIESI